MKAILGKLMLLENLTTEEAIEAMETMMSGEATHAQIAAFLTALRMKGETVDEISAFASVLRNKANRVQLTVDAMDIVGTGGDGANTFNISTAAAFVTAAAGMPVAKHGNRAASSQCGTADVLEALGCNITLSPEQAVSCLARTGICFLFAQSYHSSMKHVAQPRREMGVRTVFNLIGPLSNPAFVKHQLLGVASEALLEPMAKVLMKLGMKHAMVVYGEDGLDELTICARSRVVEVVNGEMTRYHIEPEDYGLVRANRDSVRGGNALENAAILRSVLGGETGPRRDIVLLNAGAALCVANKADSIGSGILMAREAIDSGAALAKLDAYIIESNQ